MKASFIARTVVLGLLCNTIGSTILASELPEVTTKNIGRPPKTPVTLPFKQEVKLELASESTTTIPTKEDITNQIKAIKKTHKQIDTLTALVTAAVVGGGAAIAITTATIAVILAIVAPYFPAYVPLSATGIAAVSAGQLSSIAIIAGIISGASGLTTIAGASAIFGGLTAAALLTTLNNSKQLNALLATNPELFTTEQKNTLIQFNKLLTGPIGKAIAQGIQLKDMETSLIAKALEQHPQLMTQLGDKKHAQSTLHDYLVHAKKLHNLTISLQNNRNERTTLTEERSTKKILSPKHTELGLRIMILDATKLILDSQIKHAKKTCTQLEQKYPNIKVTLKDTVQNFIQESEKIIAELMPKK